MLDLCFSSEKYGQDPSQSRGDLQPIVSFPAVNDGSHGGCQPSAALLFGVTADKLTTGSYWQQQISVSQKAEDTMLRPSIAQTSLRKSVFSYTNHLKSCSNSTGGEGHRRRRWCIVFCKQHRSPPCLAGTIVSSAFRADGWQRFAVKGRCHSRPALIFFSGK